MSKPTTYNYQSALIDGELMIIGPFHGFPVTLTYHPDMLFSYKGDQDFPKRDLMSLHHVLNWYARYHPRLTSKQRQELRDYHPLEMLSLDRNGPVDLDKWLVSIGDLISEHYLDNMGSKEPMTELKAALKEARRATMLAKREARLTAMYSRRGKTHQASIPYKTYFRGLTGSVLHVQYSIESKGSVAIRQDDISIRVHPDLTVSLDSYNPRLSDFPEKKGVHLFHMLNAIKQYLETNDLSIIVKGSPYNHKTVAYEVIFPFDGTYESAFQVLYAKGSDGWTRVSDLYADSM
jgi:hypothetical protein